CPPHNPAAMARAVRELFEGDTRQLGRQARQYVEAHHAWDAVVAGLLAHYHALLGCTDLSVALHG
ncbi:MAG: glycosyltransferase, partial [Pseudomonas sp.]